MDKILCALICLPMAMAGVAEAGVILSDDFSSTSVSDQNRYGDEDAGLWVARDSGWSVSSEQLTNDLSAGNAERAVIQLVEVTETDTSLTQIAISFDYTVPADATLYFYANGYTGPLLATLNSRLTEVDGKYFTTAAADFNDNLGTGYNLLNGTTPTGQTAAALTSLSNTSGTFSQTIDISAFAGIDDITDLGYINVVFGVDETAASGSIVIDNFSVSAVPEPSSLILMMGSAVCLIARRRR